MDPRVDARDQIELPRATFDLPDAQRREPGGGEDRQRDQQRARAAQGWALISVEGIGIMLELRWYMIHSEPAITISTITAVKT